MRCFCFILLTLAIEIGKCMELISVQSIFRHGDRAPSSPYPKDRITIDSWPNGWSQLTERGAMQTKELGSYYRRVYTNKLQLFKKNEQEILVKSTSKSRAIESAQNVMAGLFDRSSNLPEIHINGEYKHDLLLKPNSVQCYRYDQLLTADNKILFSRYDAMYRDFFQHLSDYTGYNVSMSSIDLVYDAVFREVSHGLSGEDEWLWGQVLNRDAEKLVTTFDLILDLKRVQRLGEFNSAEKSKLRTGYLLGQIFNQFERFKDGEILPKLTLYSSHDATLSSLLYSLNASNELLVPYAAAITFELYVDGLHMPTYYIKTLYRNETGNDQAYDLLVNGCERPDMCELKQFKSVLDSAMFRTIEDQRRECSSRDLTEN